MMILLLLFNQQFKLSVALKNGSARRGNGSAHRGNGSARHGNGSAHRG